MTACTEGKFLQDVASHEMVVLRDDGLHRHIRFKRPGAMCMYFDLITWPGCLCYTGDMGTYVFRRLDDMFEFFRVDERDWSFNRNGGLSINPDYWSEKLIAVDGNRHRANAMEFDADKFRATICDIRREWVKENRHRTTKEQRRELWEAIDQEVLSYADDGEHEAIDAAQRFRHYIGNGSLMRDRFDFEDLWDHNLHSFTYSFMWCCYALAWGVREYDRAKLAEAAK